MPRRRRTRTQRELERKAAAQAESEKHVRDLIEAHESVRADSGARSARLADVSVRYAIGVRVLEAALIEKNGWQRSSGGDLGQYALGIYLAYLALDDGSLFLAGLGLFGVTWVVGRLRDLGIEASVDSWARTHGVAAALLKRALIELDRLEAAATDVALRERRAKEKADQLHARGAHRITAEGVHGGIVYVVSNPSIPGKVKVGMTTRPMSDRLAELFATAVPTAFELEAGWPVRDPRSAEAKAHEVLDAHRTSIDREFFNVEAQVAVSRISGLLGPPSLGKRRAAS